MVNNFAWIGTNKDDDEKKQEFRYCSTCEAVREVEKKQTFLVKEGSTEARVVYTCKICRCVVSFEDGIKDKESRT